MGNIPIIVFGFIVLFFVWRGYRNGFVVSVARYFSCFLAYVVSVIGTNPLSKIISQYSHLQGLIVYFIAAFFIFLTVSIIANYLFGKLIDVFFEDYLGEEIISGKSKFSGAILGVLAGCFVGFLMVYIINFSQKMTRVATQGAEITEQSLETKVESESSIEVNVANEETKTEESEQVNLNQTSLIDSLSKKVVSKTIIAAVELTAQNPTATTLTEALSTNPEAAFDNLRQFINDKNVSRALSDSAMQNLLNRGDAKELLANKEFKALIQNHNIKALFVGAKEEVIADSMVVVWKRVDSVKNNPRAIEIVSDPEFIKQINSADTMQLLTNPKLKELTDIIIGKQ